MEGSSPVLVSQSNNCADIVNQSDRYRFIDDLSLMEIVNLLTVGLTSYNLNQHIPSNIPTSNIYIPNQNLKTQSYLNNISQWTDNQK